MSMAVAFGVLTTLNERTCGVARIDIAGEFVFLIAGLGVSDDNGETEVEAGSGAKVAGAGVARSGSGKAEGAISSCGMFSEENNSSLFLTDCFKNHSMSSSGSSRLSSLAWAAMSSVPTVWI